ncbi:zinc knuckle family protein [Trifolium medium]|uniref:Zinc knuckle family protein n=1 Tax=Trifolium medium TaxID=97028 RepID=A0A392NMP6_9FABA|nr:zinc knuckle family protein [Trifolium medium]
MSLDVVKINVPEVNSVPEIETSSEAQISSDSETSPKAMCTKDNNTQKLRHSEVKILKRPESETKSKGQVLPEVKTLRKQKPKTKSKIVESSRVNTFETKSQKYSEPKVKISLRNSFQKPNYSPVKTKLSTQEEITSHSWYLDSGCSRHMTGDKQLFQSLTSHDGGLVGFGGN